MNRRDFLKKCIAVGAGGFVLSNRALELSISAKHLNIVFIFIDDMGWTGTSYMGSGYYETPRIDALSREGMVFTSAYTSAPNCSPTRACLLSGQYGPRHGKYTNSDPSRKPSLERLIPIENKNYLPPEIVTIAESLKPAGYATACVGKWHLGTKAEYLPPSQGFDYVVSRDDIPAEPDVDPKRIDAFTDRAIVFMESSVNKNRPFFLYMAHHTVHGPVEATEEKIAEYEGKEPWDGHTDPNYAAMTEHTDDGVGRLLDKIDELGIRDNTVVVFYSDNGGPHGLTSNYPLRGAKGMLYEGGIRVPMTIRWPGVVRPGTICDEPITSVDFYPTLLEMASAPNPAGHILDGLSIVPLLKGAKKLNRQAIFWHFPAYLQGTDATGARDTDFRTKPVGAIRKGNWKLLQYFEELEFGDGPLPQLELYDLENDIDESNNLADAMPEKRDELLAALVAWRQSVNAPVPTEHNPAYTG